MKAMILAAGRGERMRPLSDTCPKPLLAVRGKPLIQWHVEALARAGVEDIVVNTAWLEDRLVEALGDGSRFGVRLHWSMEGRDFGGALETAGGIATALPLLGDVFWVVSGDVFVPGFPFRARDAEAFATGDRLGKLWLVPNPHYHPRGDFGLEGSDGLPDAGPDGQRWTYANIALLRAAMFDGVEPGQPAKLAPLLYAGMCDRRIACEIWRGEWANVGTPADLAVLNDASRPADFDARSARQE